MRAGGEHARAPEAELDVFLMARRGLAPPSGPSTPTEVACTHLAAEASWEDPDTLSVAS